jgi:hypothetical protein
MRLLSSKPESIPLLDTPTQHDKTRLSRTTMVMEKNTKLLLPQIMSYDSEYVNSITLDSIKRFCAWKSEE